MRKQIPEPSLYTSYDIRIHFRQIQVITLPFPTLQIAPPPRAERTAREEPKTRLSIKGTLLSNLGLHTISVALSEETQKFSLSQSLSLSLFQTKQTKYDSQSRQSKTHLSPVHLRLCPVQKGILVYY